MGAPVAGGGGRLGYQSRRGAAPWGRWIHRRASAIGIERGRRLSLAERWVGAGPRRGGLWWRTGRRHRWCSSARGGVTSLYRWHACSQVTGGRTGGGARGNAWPYDTGRTADRGAVVRRRGA
jgi:hypothetical protein